MAMGTDMATDMGMINRKHDFVVALKILLFVASTAAYGQVTVTPRVSISETMTDNVNLSSVNVQSEQITEITPGIRVNIASGRLKTYFDFGLSQVVYAQGTSPNSSKFQNALNTFGTFEAVDNWAFVDFSGNISQQTVSAFGTQSPSNASDNANQAEVSNYRMSPYVKGRLGHMADYEARYSRTVTSSDATVASGGATTDTFAKFSGDSAFRHLGWSADVGRQSVSYSAGRATEADTVNFGLSYTLTPQLNVFASGGREANDYISLDKQSSDTNSFGLNWSPSESTKVSASRGQRSFGEVHNLSFEHRSARTIWRFTDTKDVSTTPSQSGYVSLGSVYDLYFSQFASVEPDLIARAQLVNAYLQARGISPTATVVSSFLSSAVSVERRQDLLFSLLGVRDTITFLASRTESARLDTLSTAFDDLANTSVLKQKGIIVNYAHRLTPDYSLGVLWSEQKTAGDLNSQDTQLRSINVSVTGRVGQRTSATVGVRHVVFEGIAPYSETAVTGNLNVQF